MKVFGLTVAILLVVLFSFIIQICFQLSAISSVAILNDTQRAALQYVITRSAQDSKSVASKLLARVQRLGYSENDLKRCRYLNLIIIHSISFERSALFYKTSKMD